jgi:hypothetical protein
MIPAIQPQKKGPKRKGRIGMRPFLKPNLQDWLNTREPAQAF